MIHLKKLHDLQTKAILQLILTNLEEILTKTFKMEKLSKLDKASLKIMALMEFIEILLDNYFELYYENKRLKRKLKRVYASK